MNSDLNHVAIIMDGNTRWAAKRDLPSKMGHKEGVKKAREAVEFALENNIPYLTLFAFSTENWLRDEIEVKDLISIFFEALEEQTPELIDEQVKLNFIGDISRFNKRLMLKTFYTLFPELKNKLFILVFLSIFSSILDILSLGLIGPLIGMIVDKNFLLKFPIIYNFIEYLNIFNLNIFIFISFLILILFLIKSFFTYNIINFIHSFCFRQQVELRNKILRIYLSMPFIEFMKKDYSNKC